ncbi:uncharacterized protein [Lepisosteus oculatus]|uniref:uncharacterized protein isoform X3 n=1 Tax=Lepisosteus oculatus TaxID=7918 RepID=UPI0035F529A7
MDGRKVGSTLFVTCAAVWAVVSGAVSLGDTVTLPCDLELRHETTWFQHHNETLALRILASKNQVEQQTEPFYYVIRPDSRFSLVLNPSTASPDLRIEGVTETDQGLYYCATREKGEIHIGQRRRLQIEKEREAPGPPQHPGIGLPCLIVLLSALPLSALASSCCVFFILLRGRGKGQRGARHRSPRRDAAQGENGSAPYENLHPASEPRRPGGRGF